MDWLLVPGMTLHLAAVHAAAVLPLVCCGLAYRAARHSDIAASWLGRRLAWSSLGFLAVGAASGAVMLALLWLAEQRDIFVAAQRLPPYKLWYAAAELLFSVGCMVLYIANWERAVTGGRWRRFAQHLLAVMAATNLIYHFPPLFLALRQLAHASGPVLQPEFRAIIFEPRVLSMWIHHTVAGLAAAGVWTMWMARGSRRGQALESRAGVVWGARVALLATLAQIPIGLWVLVALPQRNALLGADTIATGLLAAGVVLAVGFLHNLAAAAMGETERATVLRCVGLLFAVMFLMNAANFRARRAIDSQKTTPSYSPASSLQSTA